MTELTLRKRAAKFAGELGLFVDIELWEENFRLITANSDVIADVKSSRTIEQNNFSWALAALVANNTDYFLDAEEARNKILILAKHYKDVIDLDTRKAKRVAKRTRNLSVEKFKRLLERMKYVVLSEIIPGMEEGELQAELIRMCGG